MFYILQFLYALKMPEKVQEGKLGWPVLPIPHLLLYITRQLNARLVNFHYVYRKKIKSGMSWSNQIN